MKTIKQAKEYLRENWEEGVECPCCTQFVKVYKRTISSTMAYQLIQLYNYDKTHPDQYVHVAKMLSRITSEPSLTSTGDFTKLRFWGLIQKETGKRKDGSSRTGRWRITPEGRLFVEGKIKTPNKVFIFNNTAFERSQSEVGIVSALRNKFSYEELMQI